MSIEFASKGEGRILYVVIGLLLLHLTLISIQVEDPSGTLLFKRWVLQAGAPILNGSSNLSRELGRPLDRIPLAPRRARGERAAAGARPRARVAQQQPAAGPGGKSAAAAASRLQRRGCPSRRSERGLSDERPTSWPIRSTWTGELRTASAATSRCSPMPASSGARCWSPPTAARSS